MTDKELLQLAMKAAGIQQYDPENAGDEIWIITTDNGWGLALWDPLNDDGDALRLAMKLSISIFVNGMHVNADCRYCQEDIGYFEENSARNDGCIFKAARRAIVRAAAGIGGLMP